MIETIGALLTIGTMLIIIRCAFLFKEICDEGTKEAFARSEALAEYARSEIERMEKEKAEIEEMSLTIDDPEKRIEFLLVHSRML